jgi:apolipoprotein N-acyltransferase
MEPRRTDAGQGARRAWLVFGLATFFAFPHEVPGMAGPDASSVVDLGAILAWLVPAALVVGIAGRTPGQGARLAFLASFVTHAAFFYWFLVVTMVYAGMPAWLGLLAPLLPALYVAPFTALFAWAWLRFEQPGPFGVLAGAALWVAVDWARGWLFGGFPWATLGYALHLDVPLLGVTRWTGVYGLSFVASAVGIALGRAWLARAEAMQRRRAARRTLLATVVLVIALHVLGGLAARPGGGARVVRVAAIQGNVDQGQKWAPERREQILSRYLALSERAAEAGARWIVWPETAVPGIVENDRVLSGRLAELARQHDVTLVVGGMGVEIDYAARRFSAFYDSAFLFDPDGALVDRYDKTHLVPFGEYVPLRGVLGAFFQSIATGLSSSDVTAGARPRNFALQWPEGAATLDLRAGRVLAGVPICYELLFPDLVRRFAGEGASVLLAITNDAWYGRTGAPHQFLAMTALRAAESGLPVVRAANTGVSALIDARGAVVERSRLFEEAIVVGDVDLSVGEPPTFYARFGDVFVALCGIGWGLLAARNAWGDRPGA